MSREITHKIYKMMTRPFLGVVCFGVVLLALSPLAFANRLGNSSFEDNINSGAAGSGNWDATNGTTRFTNVTKPVGFSNVPDGIYAIQQNSPAGNYTFQVVDNVKPGQFVTFSALAESSIAVGGGAQGGQIVIEFKKINDDGTDTKISEVQSAYITTANAIAGGGFQLFTIQGAAPEGTQRVVFVLRTWGGAAGRVVFDKTNGEASPAKLSVSASKRHVKKGDAIGITARFNNASGNTLTGAQMRINLPNGFDYAKDSIRVNGITSSYREGSLIIPIGTLAPGAQFEVVFATLVTSGVQLGRSYSLGVIVESTNALSETATVQFTVEGDPMFEEGTVIGKVFNDLNQNGVQDKGEVGVPWVKLYTEQGIAILTDEHGRYHIPGVQPGRHVIKIDGHTLPDGTQFITEESYLVKITPGIMAKANFAVLLPPSRIPENFQKDLTVMVTQGVDISRPKLEIQMEPEVLNVGVGILEKEPLFRIDSNYAKFVKKWAIEVRNPMGEEVWTGYGVGSPPPEITWSGTTESGLMIKPGIYSYQLKVRDEKNREDWTALKFFEVYNKCDCKAQKNYQTEIPPIGDFNLFKDGKRSIPLVAKPTVRIQGKTKPKYEVKINDVPVGVDPETGMFQKEFYVEPGEHEFNISAAAPSGESTVYQEKIKVKDSTFFMVALAEEQLGVNFANGAMEAADSDVYRDGFQQEGRVSFFLKGKLKGKFLVKAKYDTGDRRAALFTNLNPDDYYPIYGDDSSRDYEALDTAQRLYILVEMDKSYAKWGSFKTEFTDTELATYNRTLSGLKVNFDTVASTAYGDPKRGFKFFWTESGKQADHNELYATGGTLFYTRNRNITEGSEKIRVEIRDKIQGMVMSSYDLQEGADYDINYDEGRIMLSRPLSSVAATDTLVSADILDGNPVFLIVDYEYEPESYDLNKVPNRGIRGYTWIGDHLKIGGTAVEEKRPGGDYDMRGVDATVKFGRNTKITAEYATTNTQQMDSSVSYDGGLSYGTEGGLPLNNSRQRHSAYLIKGQSQPLKGLDVSGYVQTVNPGFSNGHMANQEGFDKYGLATSYKFTENLAARYRFDSSKVTDNLRPISDYNVVAPYMMAQVHTAQLTYDDGKYLAQAEYQRSNIDQVPESKNLLPTLYSEIPFKHGMATKLGYHINDRLLPYVKAQVTLESSRDYQLGGGIRCELIRNVFGYIEQMFGPLGDSTYFGFEKQHKNGRSYANLRSFDRGIGDKTLSSAVGSSFSLTEKSRIYSEREYSSYQGVDGFADILGYEGRINDHWDFGGKYERRHLTGTMSRGIDISAQNSWARNGTFNTVGGHLAYGDGKKLRARTYWEFRIDRDSPTTTQIVTRNSVKYQLNQDLAFLSYFNYGNSRFYNPGEIPATFVEMSTGFAYRPVAHDKFNMLTKYTYLKDLGSDAQYQNSYYNGVQFDDSSHIFAIDAIYDVNRWFGVAEKLAYKRANLMISTGDTISTNSFLTVNRLNFHVTRKWDVAAEYRLLWQSGALGTLRHGALFEVDREIYDYVRLGVGYNFTDFSDDLRSANDFKTNGPFVRMTGKF